MLTLSPASQGGRAVKKGGESLFVIFQNQAWFEKGENNVRSGEEGVLITYPTERFKCPEINKFPFPLGGVRFCQRPAQYSSACFSGSYLPLSRDLPLGVPNPICDILGSRMYLLLFFMLLNFSCLMFCFHLPKGFFAHCKRASQI